MWSILEGPIKISARVINALPMIMTTLFSVLAGREREMKVEITTKIK